MSIKRLIVLCLCAVLAAICIVQIQKTPALYQYALSAPKAQENEEAQNETELLLKELEQLSKNWQGIISAYAVTTHTSGVAMEGVGGAAVTARLIGVWGNPQALPYSVPVFGRRLYDSETQNGTRSIILDEQLALKLFRIGDPLGRRVMIGGETFTVVGIVRHTRGAGDQEAFGAYISIGALPQMQAETLTVWAKGVDGAGAFSKFKSDMQMRREGGSLYDLQQEKARALLPAWLSGCVCLLLVVISAFKAFGRLVLRLYTDYLERLSHCFAAEMLPRMIGYILLGLAALSAALAVFYAWTQLALTMVYIFPEWIPAVPVEISDIMTTWWQNAKVTGSVIEYRTREVLTLRRLSALLRLPSLIFALLASYMYGKRQKRPAGQHTSSSGCDFQ